MSEPTYVIDLESIRRTVPLHLEVPPLLLDFAAWLDGRSWGTVGCFDLAGQFAEQAPIVDGSLLRNELALFFHLPEGSAVGAWCQPSMTLESAPIVVLGSEGQHEVLAPNLAGLLARIALQCFEDRWSDFAPHEDGDDCTAELGDWLKRRLRLDSLDSIAIAPPDSSTFAGWLDKWCEDREEYWARHPLMVELGRRLQTYRPTGKNTWDHTSFEAAIVGSKYQVRVLRRGRQPIEQSSEIEPILRQLRDEMWRERPSLGLWQAMSFRLYADGRILPDFDYETRPLFDETLVDSAEARNDLARAPRPARWTPTWMADT